MTNKIPQPISSIIKPMEISFGGGANPSISGALVVVATNLNCELHMWPVQQQKFTFFGFELSTHSVLLHPVSVKHPFILTLYSPVKAYATINYLLQKPIVAFLTGSIICCPKHKAWARLIRITVGAMCHIVHAFFMTMFGCVETFAVNGSRHNDIRTDQAN